MTLIKRVSRLLRADVHAVLDLMEEPGALLKQALRDMEDEVARGQKELELLEDEGHQMDARRSRLERSLKDMDSQLDTCFQSEDETLARALIKQQLETREIHKHLTAKRESVELACNSLRERLDEQRSRLRTMRQKADLLVGADNTARTNYDWEHPVVTVRNEDVEVAYLRAKQARL